MKKLKTIGVAIWGVLKAISEARAKNKFNSLYRYYWFWWWLIKAFTSEAFVYFKAWKIKFPSMAWRVACNKNLYDILPISNFIKALLTRNTISFMMKCYSFWFFIYDSRNFYCKSIFYNYYFGCCIST